MTARERVGWGARLTGEEFDIEDWEECLKPAFDPWLERGARDTILRSKRLDDLSTAEAVRDRALVLISRLNAAFAVSYNANPVHFNGLVAIFSDGTHDPVTLVEHSVVLGRTKRRATIVTGGKIPSPQPSAAQRWIALAKLMT
jgi:hypothetical protein